MTLFKDEHAESAHEIINSEVPMVQPVAKENQSNVPSDDGQYASPKTESSDSIFLENLIAFIRSQGFRKNEFVNRVVNSEGQLLDDDQLATINIEARKHLGKSVMRVDVKDILNGNFLPRFNPVNELFLEWSLLPENNEMEKFVNCFHFQKNVSGAFISKLMIKWMMQFPAMALDNIHPRLVLVLIGPSHIGKSTLFRDLLPTPLKPYYAESNLKRGKDSMILMSEKFLINIDEFGGLAERNPDEFKSIVSAQDFNERAVYGSNNRQFIKRTILCGTSNTKQIIRDTTALNTRIIPCPLESIDWDTLNSINRTFLMADITHKYLKSGQDESSIRLSKEEISELGEYSKKFIEQSIEMDCISDFVIPGETFVLAIDVLKHLRIKTAHMFSYKSMANVLSKLGIESDKIRIKGYENARHGYYVTLIG